VTLRSMEEIDFFGIPFSLKMLTERIAENDLRPRMLDERTKINDMEALIQRAKNNPLDFSIFDTDRS
jgi:hypothetical protein